MPLPVILPVTVIACAAVVGIVAMSIVGRTFSSRRTSTPRALANEDLARRLERIELAVETTAVEVERMAEANRYLTKLLAEKAKPTPR